MFCTHCGKNLPDNANFCDGCGAQIGAAQPQAQPQQTPYAQPQQATYVQQPAPQPQQRIYVQQAAPQPVPQAAVYQQQTYYPTSSTVIQDFANKANTIKTLGIVSAVLCLGIGFIFSIILLVKASGLSEPNVIPANQYEAEQLEKAKKNIQTGKKLSAIPFIAIGISFLVGFLGGFLAYI